MKKKIKIKALSILMAILMVATIIPIGAISSFALTSGDYDYSVISETDKTAKIDKYNGTDIDITIPSTIDGYTVTGIGDSAFSGCVGLTSVTIPDSVTNIADWAFEGCTGLTNVTIGNGTIEIGNRAFEGCNSLTTINISEGNSVYSSIDGIVYNKDKTSLLLFPQGKSGEITISDSVTNIGGEAFWGCTGLTAINVSEGNIVFSSIDGILYNKDKTKLFICPNGTSLTSVIIPNSVTSIVNAAFAGCAGLKDVTIPNSVTNIGDGAFYYCTSLTSVTIPDSVTSIGYSAFDGTPFYNSMPDGEVYLGKVFYKYKGTMPKDTEINIKAGTVSISDDAFSGCTDLKSVTIPDSVTYIGRGAFEGTSFYNSLPDGEVYLGKVLYEYKGTMPENTEIIIKSGTISISNYAFDHCKGLKGVTIPNSVTSIGNYAFDTCTSLTSVIIPDSVTSIGDCAFAGCTGLKSVIIGNSVTSIGWGAFQVCTGLKSIIIPNSVTSIGTFAFWNCTGLKGVTIPDSVTSIESMAFGYFMDGGDAQLPNFTITGTKGSAAEEYATANGFTFIDVTAPTRMLGDVTGDGKVTAADAILALRAEAKLKELSPEEFKAADVTGDGKVTAADAIKILRFEAKLIDKL